MNTDFHLFSTLWLKASASFDSTECRRLWIRIANGIRDGPTRDVLYAIPRILRSGRSLRQDLPSDLAAAKWP